ncbi:putative ubiquitin-conjugating enzyme E2 25 [Capsicum baccatum]|uniref:Ubiquitin-conjugating enzyme E2 25 n=1 Tax=Capsicum baccatum TaxID=33114 RepID=A0A2G2VSB9_CAPBA|nr:putative ubiquitin-conjugating enzyme E2 25 [Capsicum baccatum]
MAVCSEGSSLWLLPKHRWALAARGSLNRELRCMEAITKDNPHTVAGNTSRCPDSGNNNSSNSDLTFYEDQNDRDEGIDNFDDVSNYDDNDDYLFYKNDDDDKCDYLSMQAQFDNADLPAGVEATVSWLNEPTSSLKVSSQVSFSSHLASGQTSTPINSEHVSSNFPQVPSSSSTLVSGWSNSHGMKEATEDELMKNIIYVRVCEAQKDLLRVVIIEPQGTPYHDGLFIFDILFPQNYPDVPTMVYYYPGGLRLNPNLYNYGKVCLGLLNTWSGKGNEKWLPKTSSMLQVLVSIQALILNANPFFDEHGYEISYAGCEGERRSHACHEDAFVLSLKTMTRRPPKVMIVYPGSNFYFI